MSLLSRIKGTTLLIPHQRSLAVCVDRLSVQQLRWKRTSGKPSNQNGDRTPKTTMKSESSIKPQFLQEAAVQAQQNEEDKIFALSEKTRQPVSTMASSKPEDTVHTEKPSSTTSPSKEETKNESTAKLDKASISYQIDATTDSPMGEVTTAHTQETKKEIPSKTVSEEAKPSFSSTVTQRDAESESIMKTSTKVEEKGSIDKNLSDTTLEKTPSVKVPSNTSPSWMSAPSSASLQDMRRMLEEATGVEEIAALKEAVVKASNRLDTATLRVQEMRQQLDENALKAQEISTQHAAMMQNRSSWNEQDVQAFAQLTAAEGKARQLASTSRQAVRQAEDEMQKSLRDYMDALRRRYHEEQVWQDRWRVLGTYWTWSLIALNSVVFVVGQALHYRREERRLLSLQEMFREYATRAETSAAAAMSQKTTIETAKPVVEEDIIKGGGVEETTKKSDVKKRKRTNATDKPKKAPKETSINLVWSDQWQDWTRSTGTLLQATGRVVQRQIVLWKNVTLRATGTGLKASQRTVLNLWDGTIQTTKAGASRLVDASKVGAVATKNTAEDIWKNKRVQKMWTRREELMKQIHWPSVAMGAVASSVGLFLLSSSRPK